MNHILSVAALVTLVPALFAQKKPATPKPKPPSQTLPSQWVETAVKWRSIGPANMSGRVVDFAVYEKDPTLYWIATASGGLLKTDNDGITFEHQFDHENTVSIGAVAVSQSNPKIVWVGTGENNPRNSVSYGDGVYKSVDGGKTWKHMGLRKSFQTGDIVIHPTDPNIVYVGALGRLYGPSEERGLYKTSDGGKTWKRILYIDDKTGIVDIAMNPIDPNVLLVAAYERRRDGFDTNDPAKKIGPGSGLYRTMDGGRSFDKISVGLPTCKLGRIGLDWYRKNPTVVYALVESEKIGMAGEKVGFSGLTTQNADAGAKVTGVTKDGPGAKAGIKVGDIVLSVGKASVLSSRQFQEAMAQHEIGDKVTLAVARAGKRHEIEVALTKRPPPARNRGGRGNRRGGSNRRQFGTRLGGQVANIGKLQGKDGYQHGGLYRSHDSGLTWARINSIDPRPMYFSQIRVDPLDEKYLYVLGVSAARSQDGGKTFKNDAGRGVHADQHAMWIDPKDGRHMLLGCDGGMYVTRDRTRTWRHLNDVAMGQFYHVAVGPRRDYWVYGGLQDNGSWGGPQRAVRGSGPVNENWLRIGGGDGFVCAVDKNDPNQIYYESQNGGMGRTNLATMEGGRIRPRAPARSGGGRSNQGRRGPRGNSRYRFNWKTPFLLSHHNSRIFYCAGNRVFRSLHKGDDLKPISPNITLTDRGSATALAESPKNADVLYVGTDDGALWGTKDGGANWTDLLGREDVDITEASSEKGDTGGDGDGDGDGQGNGHGKSSAAGRLRSLIPGPRWVSSIEASRAVEGRVYVCLDAHRSDDDNPYLFCSEDYGQTWKPLSKTLPWGSTRVLREDIKNPDVLYAGTEFGIYVSVNRGKDWTRFNGNLPTVAIHEVAQHETSGEIVVATHGRSLWILDVTPIRQMSPESIQADSHLYEPNAVVRWVMKHRRGTSGGASQFTGQNPSSDAVIFYSLGKDAKSLTLTVQDAAGTVLAKLDGNPKAGLHRAAWNQRRAMTDADRRAREAELRARFGANFERFRRFIGNRQPRVDPGTYQVVLDVDGHIQRAKLTIENDPNFPNGR